jgi:hypothetical protein
MLNVVIYAKSSFRVFDATRRAFVQSSWDITSDRDDIEGGRTASVVVSRGGERGILRSPLGEGSRKQKGTHDGSAVNWKERAAQKCMELNQIGLGKATRPP